MMVMIWNISVPLWIKWRPQGREGGLQKCDCSASNKLHFMLHVKPTTFFFSTAFISPHFRGEKLEPGPALKIRLKNPFTDGNLNFNEPCLQFVIHTATDAGCPILCSTFDRFNCRRRQGLVLRACAIKHTICSKIGKLLRPQPSACLLSFFFFILKICLKRSSLNRWA